MNPLLHKPFQKIKEVQIFSKLFYEVSITLITKSDRDMTRKQLHRLLFLINTEAKILSKMSSNNLAA